MLPHLPGVRRPGRASRSPTSPIPATARSGSPRSSGCELLDEGPPRVGQRWLDHTAVGLAPEMVITEIEHRRASGPRPVAGAAIEADLTLGFSPHGAGGCRVDVAFEVRGRRPAAAGRLGGHGRRPVRRTRRPAPRPAASSPSGRRLMGRVVGGVFAVLLVVVGLVWTFQGLGYVKGSPMTGVEFWAVVGPGRRRLRCRAGHRRSCARR